MIRLLAGLCKTIFESLTDEAVFHNAVNGFHHHDKQCPYCGAVGKLSPYGKYFRSLVSFMGGKVEATRISPLRFICKSCNRTHALLPDILTPYSPYSLRSKLTVLIAYFERETTVVSICERYEIAVSTLYEWKKQFLEHKELFLGVLASQKEPSLAFLRGLLESGNLSERLGVFFQKYAFSFLQRRPTAASGSSPP